MGALSILTLSDDRVGRLSSGTSHLMENSVGYKSIRFKSQTCRLMETLQV
jgi:hypothetical protein